MYSTTNGCNLKRRKLNGSREDLFSEGENKVFNDSIFGTLEMHPLCVKVIDTPQFQRLRYIKQVGSCYFVFPSAAHNRFEHSIGVCHLAGDLVEALDARQPELEITKKDILCVKLAGLCHDLGHGPFSHLWESFMHRIKPEKNWKHEYNSAKMFDYLIESNELDETFESFGLNEQDLVFIKEMITISSDQLSPQWKLQGRPQSKNFLYEIVSNKRTGVDVDKWDYIMRDTQALGLNSGKLMFDYKRLIKFSRVIPTPNEGLQICFRDKEVDNLFDMFHTRKTLHRVAYQHKVNKLIDAMVIDALLLANEHITYTSEDGVELSLCDVGDDPFAYTHLTDDVLNCIYRSSSIHPDMIKAKQIIHRIYSRKLYKIVGQTLPTNKIADSGFLFNKLQGLLPGLTINDMAVLAVNLDYGMGSENPINNCRFFTKQNPNVSYVIRSDDTSMMLPKVFQEKVFLLFVKRDADVRSEVEGAFLSLCEDLNLRRAMGDESIVTTSLTPEKMANGETSLKEVNRN